MKRYLFSKKDLEKDKTQIMEEAWDYFKKKENIPQNTNRVNFEKDHAKDSINDRWGAFKHTYTSAAFTRKYGLSIAKLAGDANEIVQFGINNSKVKDTYAPGNEPQDRRMDLKNNSAGRKIALKYSGQNLLDKVYSSLDSDKNIVLNQYKNNDTPYNDTPRMNKVWKLADKAYENKDTINKVLQGKVSFDEIRKAPLSLKDKLIRFREEKLAQYTHMLSESKENIEKKAAAHVSLQELKTPQNNRINKVHEMIQKHEEKLRNNKSKASGPIHVDSYTRSDGTNVRSYYRSR